MSNTFRLLIFLLCLVMALPGCPVSQRLIPADESDANAQANKENAGSSRDAEHAVSPDRGSNYWMVFAVPAILWDNFKRRKRVTLHSADSPEKTAALLRAGQSPNSRDEHGATPLHHVKDAETAALLLKAGAKPNRKDASGNTPLHYVKSPEIAALLLKAKANPNAVNDDEDTPLHGVQSAEVAALLLKAGANPQAGIMKVPLPYIGRISLKW